MTTHKEMEGRIGDERDKVSTFILPARLILMPPAPDCDYNTCRRRCKALECRNRPPPIHADAAAFSKMAITPLLAKKTALITGGSSGIGLAIAKTFASNGASCILMARNPQPLEIAVKELSMLNAHETFPGDVKSEKTWKLFDDVFVSFPSI